MKKDQIKLIKSGYWLYNNNYKKIVRIISLNFDFWYEIGKENNDLNPNEKPNLNSEGVLYYVLFKEYELEIPIWVDSTGFKSIEKAMKFAEQKAPSKINWN